MEFKIASTRCVEKGYCVAARRRCVVHKLVCRGNRGAHSNAKIVLGNERNGQMKIIRRILSLMAIVICIGVVYYLLAEYLNIETVEIPKFWRGLKVWISQ